MTVAAPGIATTAGAQSADTPLPAFERRVYPFEVSDAEGIPYEHPFVGGFNIPRPQLADIDGDGDLDLFVQEYSNGVMFFEQVGTPEEPRYRWRTDRFQDLDVGEWYLIVDVDDDGDLDVFGEEPFSLVRYWRNDGDATQPSYTLLTERVQDAEGEPLFADRQNIPKLADIDCDHRLDFMLGRVEGTITRYEEAGEDAAGAPTFRKITDRFQDIEIIGQIVAGLTGREATAGGLARSAATLHGANTMALEDIDNDGDLDLFWGDFFEPGLLFIENTGSCGTPALRSEPTPFPVGDPIRTSGYNAPTFGDLDADGDPDLLVGVLGGAFNPNLTTVDNMYLLEQTGSGRFETVTRRYVTAIDVGSESFPAFADLDGDGDLDLLLGNKIEPDDPQSGRLYHFENTGTGTGPAFRLQGALEQFSGSYHFAPAFGDLDDDGDVDMIMGIWDDTLGLVINQGSAAEPEFVVTDPELVTITRGRNSTPALGDVDGDGDLDLFIGESSGTVNFYRNVGTAAAPEFELVSDEYLDIDVGRRSAPTLADIDGDGDLDLVVGSEAEGLLLVRNGGTQEAPDWQPGEPLDVPVHPFSTPTFVDLDGDGDLDLVAGGIAGGLIYYENVGG